MIRRRYHVCDRVVRWKRIGVSVQHIVAALTIVTFVACTGPEPMLRSNAKLLLEGREAAKLDVDKCHQKVEATGLHPDAVNRSGNVGAGAVLGLIGGASVGASSGLVGGVPGVTIGAAVGGLIGVIIGSVGGGYRPIDPDPLYADAVVGCLTEKGYHVTGWE